MRKSKRTKNTKSKPREIGVQCNVVGSTKKLPAVATFVIDMTVPDKESEKFMIDNRDRLAEVFLLLLEETMITVKAESEEKNPNLAGIYR